MTTMSADAALLAAASQPTSGRSWRRIVAYTLLIGAGLFLGLIAGLFLVLATGLITLC